MALASDVSPLPSVPYPDLSFPWGRINTTWETLGFFSCQNVLVDTFYMLPTNLPTNHGVENPLQSCRVH